MRLSEQRFFELQDRGELALSFIGMSNVGKTHWSSILRGDGFRHVNCDDLVEERLARALAAEGYAGGLQDVGRWMGMPYDDRYRANQQTFLDVEREVMNDILDATALVPGNTVIDTTGSVIYTGDAIRSRLQRASVVIYLIADDEMVDTMYQRYLREPKPVVFGDLYKPERGETVDDALGRCYKNVLAARAEHYGRWADMSVERKDIVMATTAQDIAQVIVDKL